MGGLLESVLSATCPQQQPQKGTGQQGRKKIKFGPLIFLHPFAVSLSISAEKTRNAAGSIHML